jgi:hypothetical protein
MKFRIDVSFSGIAGFALVAALIWGYPFLWGVGLTALLASWAYNSSMNQCRTLLTRWVGERRHARCWYYPEIFRQLCEVLNVQADEPTRVSRQEFETGCRRFTDEEFGPPPAPQP